MNEIDQKVLNFYEKLPFNIYGDIDNACKNIRKFDLKKVYPFLFDSISKSKTIIDVGCGGGWLVNSIAYKFDKDIYGVDFNPVAINFAKKVTSKMSNKVSYEVKNIFDYTPSLKFDLILSMGVLHHTHDCLLALDKICKFGKKNSMIYVGLYHKYGRKPFLEFVETIKGLPEEESFEEYKKIHKLEDELHLKSWFRDQVLHPHESLHGLEEVLRIFKKNGYEFTGTSINSFKQTDTISEILRKEKDLYEYGKKKIQSKIYYPGFFIVGGIKK